MIGTDPHGTYFQIDGPLDAPPIMLLHGVGLDLNMWTLQVEALAEQFKVIRYDMLGHGQSSDPSGDRCLADFVRQLEALMAFLDLPAATLVGFSMGGLIAQSFAVARPDRLMRLVLMNTVYNRTPAQRQAVLQRVEQVEAEGVASTVEAAIARWFSSSFQRDHAKVVDTIRQRLHRNDRDAYLKAYRTFATAEEQPPQALGKVHCPTLVVTGELDVGSTPEMAYGLGQCIPGAEVVIMAGQRHMAPVEAATQMNQILLDFLTAS